MGFLSPHICSRLNMNPKSFFARNLQSYAFYPLDQIDLIGIFQRERKRIMVSNSEVGSLDFETLISTSDVELLKRAWRNEKAAPEILQYEGALVERAKEQIELVEETIEDYVKNGVDPLVVSLYQMDLDRTQFLLRSYLRVRLLKIEKFMFHNLKSEEAERRLSEQEKVFATRCADDLAKYFEESVLLKLPENYQSVIKQSLISEEDDMGTCLDLIHFEPYMDGYVEFMSHLCKYRISVMCVIDDYDCGFTVPQPHLDTFVVCKSKNFVSLNLYEEGESPETVEMERGDLYFIRYKTVKAAIESGQIDLI